MSKQGRKKITKDRQPAKKQTMLQDQEQFQLTPENQEPVDQFFVQDPQQIRLRQAQEEIELAKQKLKENRLKQFLEDDRTDQQVGQILRTQALMKRNKLFVQKKNLEVEGFQVYKGHLKTMTTVKISSENGFMLSAAKDSSIIKWDIETKKKTFLSRDLNPAHHSGQINCSALSSDGTLYATAGFDGVIRLWDCKRETFIQTLKGHKAAINCMTFGLNTLKLISAGVDRMFKVWDGGQRTFLDTFYGHRDETISVDAVNQTDFVTSGFDQQVIFWRTEKEAQMIFEGHSASIDCVRALTNQTFVTGSMDGDLLIWNAKKKKPRVGAKSAHSNNWITALGSQFNSNLLLSGSYNKQVNCYQAGPWEMKPVLSFESQGVVNQITWDKEGKLVALAEGEEHRLGSWFRKPAKNQIRLVKLKYDV